MDKKLEEEIYKTWEEKGYFRPEINPNGKPYSIILPPPNANGALHFGHAMYTVEDILIRYHRMKGFQALWLPGTDHAGIETQYVFEKKLKNEGKSRLDFDRETLYKMIWDYVEENRGGIENQLRRLGFSLDWSRQKYTLDMDIVSLVHKTFKKMHDEGLIYRAEKLVNFCTVDQTSFSDLEVVYEEREDSLFYIKYGPLVLATTRPETKFGDTALAVNPKDSRYKQFVEKEIEIEDVLAMPAGRQGKSKIKVVADGSVDPKFGTGVVKVTPAHDFSDYEIGKRHNLPIVQVIGFDGKLNKKAGKFEGLYVKEARKQVVEELKKKNLLDKIDENYKHRVGVCYKCGAVIEPLPKEQWFVSVEKLKKDAIEAVKKEEIKITPKNFENHYFSWLESLKDWNISRQIVWGIRIPAYFRSWKPPRGLYVMGFHERTVEQVYKGKTVTYRLRDHGVKEGDRFTLENSQTLETIGYGTIQKIEIKKVDEISLKDPKHGATYEKVDELIKALQFHHPDTSVTKDSNVWVYTYSFGKLKEGSVHEIFVGDNPRGEGWEQDTDTFDTWFSSSQWPFVTLQTTKKGDFEKFYPTDVLETAYDILRAWVSRMVMMGIYVTEEVPFENVLFHGIVNDPYGKKMSKSKGNVINPLELVDQYGADAVRFALIYGNATGNDQAMSYTKLEAAKKFVNKMRNMVRFVLEMRPARIASQSVAGGPEGSLKQTNFTHPDDKKVKEVLDKTVKKVTQALDNFDFNLALSTTYEFIWHYFADIYIEQAKKRREEAQPTLEYVLEESLKLLHPFMPFITEEFYMKLPGHSDSIMISKWPAVTKVKAGKAHK